MPIFLICLPTAPSVWASHSRTSSYVFLNLYSSNYVLFQHTLYSLSFPLRLLPTILIISYSSSYNAAHYPVTYLSRLSVEVIAGQQRPSIPLTPLPSPHPFPNNLKTKKMLRDGAINGGAGGLDRRFGGRTQANVCLWLFPRVGALEVYSTNIRLHRGRAYRRPGQTQTQVVLNDYFMSTDNGIGSFCPLHDIKRCKFPVVILGAGYIHGQIETLSGSKCNACRSKDYSETGRSMEIGWHRISLVIKPPILQR